MSRRLLLLVFDHDGRCEVCERSSCCRFVTLAHTHVSQNINPLLLLHESFRTDSRPKMACEHLSLVRPLCVLWAFCVAVTERFMQGGSDYYTVRKILFLRHSTTRRSQVYCVLTNVEPKCEPRQSLETPACVIEINNWTETAVEKLSIHMELCLAVLAHVS